MTISWLISVFCVIFFGYILQDMYTISNQHCNDHSEMVVRQTLYNISQTPRKLIVSEISESPVTLKDFGKFERNRI